MRVSSRFIVLSIFLAVSQTSWGQRDTIDLNGMWNFAADSLRQGMLNRWYSIGLPKETTRPVKIPHTWNTMPDLQTYVGMGWYERTVSVPASWTGRRMVLRFSAVYHDATVWVNGSWAGAHHGSGYTPFSIDVAQLVHAGRVNTISVAADNAYSRSSIPFDRSFDWPNDGGILRPVALIALPQRSITRLRVSGVPQFTDRGSVLGTVNVSFDLQGKDSEENRALSCELFLRRHRAGVITTIVDTVVQVHASATSFKHTFAVTQVAPWGIDAPNLYSLEARLKYGTAVVDREKADFGFREIHTEGTQLILNGQPVRLMGVEWMPGSSLTNGMAETTEEMTAMLKKLRGANAVFTRFHWQQDESVIEWCDKHGILVQEEIPLWGKPTPLNDTVLALAKRHLDEMIDAHGNHPSIVMWGVGNELESQDPVIVKGVRQLYRYAKGSAPHIAVHCGC